jgi:hypothetical protein
MKHIPTVKKSPEESLLFECDWLRLTCITYRRNKKKYYVTLPHGALRRNIEYSYYMNRKGYRVKKEVINFFDPANNKFVAPTFNRYDLVWKFPDRSEAEKAIHFALLRWPGDDWKEEYSTDC